MVLLRAFAQLPRLVVSASLEAEDFLQIIRSAASTDGPRSRS